MFSRKNQHTSAHQQRPVSSYNITYNQNNNTKMHHHNGTMDTLREKLREAAFPGFDRYSGGHRGTSVSGRQHSRQQSGDQRAHTGGGGGGGGGHSVGGGGGRQQQQQQHGGGNGGGVGTVINQYHTSYDSGVDGAGAARPGPGIAYGGNGLYPQHHLLHVAHPQYHPFMMPTMTMPPHYGYGGVGGIGGMMMYDPIGIMPTTTMYPQHQQSLYNPYMNYDPAMMMMMMNNPCQGEANMMNPKNIYNTMYGNPAATAMMMPTMAEGPYSGPMSYGGLMMGPQQAYYNPKNYNRFGGLGGI